MRNIKTTPPGRLRAGGEAPGGDPLIQTNSDKQLSFHPHPPSVPATLRHIFDSGERLGRNKEQVVLKSVGKNNGPPVMDLG